VLLFFEDNVFTSPLKFLPYWGTKLFLRIYSYCLWWQYGTLEHIDDIIHQCEKEFPQFFKKYFRLAYPLALIATFNVVFSYFSISIFPINFQLTFYFGFKFIGLFYEYGALFALGAVFIADCVLFYKRKQQFLDDITNGVINNMETAERIFQEQFLTPLYKFVGRWNIHFLFALAGAILSQFIYSHNIIPLGTIPSYAWRPVVVNVCVVCGVLFAASVVTQCFSDIYDFVQSSEVCQKYRWTVEFLDSIDPRKHKLGFRLMNGRTITRGYVVAWLLFVVIHQLCVTVIDRRTLVVFASIMTP